MRGWQESRHDTRDDMTRANEVRRLNGAAERAERNRIEHGGFAGLTDASEALAIGEKAQSYAPAELRAFAESDPTIFAGGAHYVTDAEARAARAETDAAIRLQEEEEFLYKERFKGLSADEGLKVGESVQLGGAVVDVGGEDAASKPKRKMPKGLAAKLQKKSAATPVEAGAGGMGSEHRGSRS